MNKKRNLQLQEKVKNKFINFCFRNKFIFNISHKDYYIRFDITDFINETIVNVYQTGTVLIQGPDNSLRDKFEKFKNNR